MNLVNCKGCGNQVSPQASSCPRCGHPIARSGAASSSGLSTVLMLVLLCGLGFGAYNYLLSPTSRGTVNAIASATGVPIVPWIDRAHTAADTMFRGPDGENVARSVRSITHPTGTGGHLSNFSISVAGDQLITRLDVTWNGGFLGSSYITSVEWTCSQAGHVGTRIVADNAFFNVAQQNQAQLDAYFRTTVFPILAQRSN
jgi:hypothetical protein